MQYTIPPRDRVVRISEPASGELSMRIVAQLTETADPQRIRKLISGDQLAVSPDGLYCAHIATFRRGVELAIHSEAGILKPFFLRLGPDAGTRLLRVDEDSLLVWGKVEGYPTGLWRLSHSGSAFITALDRLWRDASGILRGTLQGQVPQTFVLTGWGCLWPVDREAIVSPSEEGLCVVEQMQGVTYAYRLHKGEIEPFQALTLTDAQRPVGIVSWQGCLMLAVVRASQSWLVEINRRLPGEYSRRIQIDGELERVWSSPDGSSLAILLHPRGEPKAVRRLQMADGKVVHEGRFHVDASSVRWSPNGQAMALKIREGDGADRVLEERVVGAHVDHRIAHGFHLREFLVNDAGCIAASIQHDGQYDQPIIGSRRGTRVPLAWNLRYTAQGDLCWTTVHDDRILTWTQQWR